MKSICTTVLMKSHICVIVMGQSMANTTPNDPAICLRAKPCEKSDMKKNSWKTCIQKHQACRSSLLARYFGKWHKKSGMQAHLLCKSVQVCKQTCSRHVYMFEQCSIGIYQKPMRILK
jgi:hypothetical protein